MRPTTLDTTPLLAGLNPDQRARVGDTAREVRFAAGQRLFEEGRPAVGCWVVRDGRVALDLHVPGRGTVVVQTLGPGEVAGWSWLVPPRRWEFGAVATTDTLAWEFDTDRLRTLGQRDPALGYALALGVVESLLHRLQATRARLLDLYRSDGRD
jgi:CRP/FNR family transcriptional regulator, cyclic AMP receptor protein